jgi:hypothetical protein
VHVRSRRRTFWVLAFLIVVGAGVVRALPIDAGLPYLAYIDEGHVVRHSADMIADRTWDPGWYLHPSLTINATALVAGLDGLVTGDVRPGARVTQASAYYDIVEPTDLILAGRLVVLAFATGTVLLTILLGTRLMGARVGLFAGLLAAILPALVSRSAIVIIDTPATFFTTAAALAATYLTCERRSLLAAVGAGAAVGCAFASKYPAGASFVIVLVAIALLGDRSLRRRIELAAASALAAAGAAVIAMPALVVHPRAVRADMNQISDVYQAQTSKLSFVEQLVDVKEVGVLVLALALLGIVVLLRRSSSRPVSLGYVVFGAVLVGFWLRYTFQPLRNLLPLMPFVCVAVAAAVVWCSRTVAARFRLSSRVRDGLAAAAMMLVVAVLVVGGIRPYYDRQVDLVDSRVEARRWLETHVEGSDRVLVAEDLALLPSELARIPARVDVRPSDQPLRRSMLDAYDYVVTANIAGEGRSWARGLRTREPAASFGSARTPATPNYWRGNDELVTIYQAAPDSG